MRATNENEGRAGQGGAKQAVSPQENRQRWSVGLLLLLLAAVLSQLPRGCGSAATMTPPKERGTAPELVLPLLDGRTWSLREHRGEVVLVNLWARWCGPCRDEMPALEALAERAGGPAVVGIAVDGGAEEVRRTARQLGVRYPLALSGPALPTTGAVEAVPTTMLFDRQGRLATVWVGAARRGAMERAVQTLQAER